MNCVKDLKNLLQKTIKTKSNHLMIRTYKFQT